MPFSPQTLEEKPYNMCLNCAHIGKHCDGPNFLAMTVERWCEWCRLRKEYLGWSNAHVAELSEISKISVDRIMSANVKDLRISTMQSITKVLVNGTWGQYPCVMPSLSEAEPVYIDNPSLIERADRADAECERLRKAMEQLTVEHKENLAVANSGAQRKIDFLLEQVHFKEEQMRSKDKLLQERFDFIKRKDRVILTLSFLLGLSLAVIIGALIIDRLNPDLGFIWREYLASRVAGKTFWGFIEKLFI